MLFRELSFFLSPTLRVSAEDKEELERLIRQNGGVVAQSPAGATHIVDYTELDARRPELVSADFIKESVAFRALQDPVKYSGKVFTTQQESRKPRNRVRMRYTNETDAKLLHFAKQRGWKAPESLALSVWQIAESDKVTAHTAHSMHERFRKHLQMTTPREQRTIMSNAAATIRARWLEKEAAVEEIDEEEKEEQQQVVEPTPLARASPNSTGFRDVVTPVRTPNSASRQGPAMSEPATIESRLREVGDKKLSDRTRSRKPKSPLRLSQRLQPSEGAQSNLNSNKDSGSNVVPPVPTAGAQGSTPAATLAAPATPAAAPEVPCIQAVQSTPAAVGGSASSPPSGNQNAGRSQQKRKRGTPRSDTTSSQESSPSRKVEGSEADSVESTTSGDNGIFFRSAWAQQIGDPTKRRMLQRFFDPPSRPALQSQTSSAESSINSDQSGADGTQARSDLDERMSEVQQVQVDTDQETDEIICQLQMDTHQNMPAVVHALYHCSGDVEMARAFLKGASPPDMWSPEDDLLLAHLLAEQRSRRAAVDAAVIRGDFSSMQVTRDADTILKRIKFLR
ncbi:hypothetical protein PF005_g16720 [Phytophthora fragariae]|uniref:BRCT domain-containing protein n=1 Tax=Phytophthora fragariae TaxID=53985 RepID=A0A6A3T451_9STRA|nr:hypothetical protein PF003_g22 [Phytophthora fragariae]KAE8932583.1 hypothetical protein PF009_g17396 [Phytophthora fragariae]KAE8996892.1 hypothetical protein PF011_g15721 [Phytophthora fragariae]KAE9096064.1 hypothetical protein PF010_g16477 [Phytophthora fragariae]KAE9100092.1 hypothetical protein PF007_g15652 [Phytophthora fragariae]